MTSFEQFCKDGYNKLLTRDLPLTSESLVLDFGGFRGDWAKSIRDNYGCRLHIFEPVPDFCGELEIRFLGDPRVTIHDYAIGSCNEVRRFGFSGDESGVYSSGQQIDVNFRTAASIRGLFDSGVDLVAINIEGGEYELFPALEDAGALEKIGVVLVQFHKVGEESRYSKDKESCREMLSRTHELTWAYDFVWERWDRRTSVK